MAIGHLWAGRLFGTNIGNVFVKLEGEDAALSGIARFADSERGVVIYSLAGVFDGTSLSISGTADTAPDAMSAGNLEAKGDLDSTGALRGEWQTSLGTGGTFVLFPHDHDTSSKSADSTVPPGEIAEADQLHTKRHNFGAIEVNKEQIVSIGEKLQAEFPESRVVVTVSGITEQSRFLDDFKQLDPPFPKAEVIKFFVQRPERGGVNRTATVEFGPSFNFVMTQSSDEAWTLGMVEKFKRFIAPYERSYAINIRKLGFGINQILLFWALVFLPEVEDMWWRVGFLLSVLFVIYLNNQLHARYLPLATIVLGAPRSTFFGRISPSFLSWLLAVLSGVAVSIFSAYAKGWLHIPTS
jgi:hypothetical protein